MARTRFVALRSEYVVVYYRLLDPWTPCFEQGASLLTIGRIGRRSRQPAHGLRGGRGAENGPSAGDMRNSATKDVAGIKMVSG